MGPFLRDNQQLQLPFSSKQLTIGPMSAIKSVYRIAGDVSIISAALVANCSAGRIALSVGRP